MKIYSVTYCKGGCAQLASFSISRSGVNDASPFLGKFAFSFCYVTACILITCLLMIALLVKREANIQTADLKKIYF